jgi:hypothetical protein
MNVCVYAQSILDYGLGNRRNVFPFTAGLREFFFSKTPRLFLERTQWTARGSFSPAVKQPGLKADHWTLCSIFKNEWGYTSTLLYAIMGSIRKLYLYVGMFLLFVGRDSSVGIATRYGLDGRGIESRWGRDFPHLSRTSLEPTHPPLEWVSGISQG